MTDIYELPDLYDQQYRHYRDDFHHYRRLAEDYGSPVLELGAGTGRLTLALAGSGHQVVAVESQREMIDAARRRINEEGLSERVELVHADMRGYELERRFPLVVAPFNTLMHLYTLDDQDQALRGVRRHLRQGGAFACDLFVPRFEQLDVLRRVPEWRQVGGEDGELFVVQEHDPVRQLIVSNYRLDLLASDGTVRRLRATLRQRYFTRFELERALRQAGFGRIRTFGDFERGPFTAESTRLVIIASDHASS